MNPVGKGFYIWRIPNCEKGDPEKIALAAHQAGLGHVLIKIANGIYDYNYGATGDLVAPVADALHKYNIQVWGWHYVFGDAPKGESKAAIRQINNLPIDGYVIDAEAEYKGKYTPCRYFMGELRNAFPDFPMALSSFRYPKYHRDLPWKDFLSHCQFNMPQVYWEQAHNPDEQLVRCIDEFNNSFVEPIRPIVPTGAAYNAGGWFVSKEDIITFMNKAVELKIPSINFWSWDFASRVIPEIWDTIAAYEWPNFPNPDKTLPERFIDALNSNNIDSIVNLYASDAIHINEERTIQGYDNFRSFFTDLLSGFPHGSTFLIESMSVEATTIQLNWNVTNNSQTVLSFEDTIGISNNKIIYHYSLKK